MDTTVLERLCDASVAKTYSPEKDVPWGIPFDSAEPQAIPDALLSLYGTSVFARLDESARRKLARHEVASFFSTFVRFEGVLNENLARFVRVTDPEAPLVAYYLHVIEEEARHSRMFIHLVHETAVGSYPLHGLLGMVETLVSGWLRASKPLFLIAMLGVEEITDRIFALMLKEELHPTVREVCRIHRIEEARHMRFAADLLRDEYAAANRLHRFLIRVATPVVLSLIFDILVPPWVYSRAGLAHSPRQSWSLYRQALRSPHRRALRLDAMKRISETMREIGILSPGMRRGWTAAHLAR